MSTTQEKAMNILLSVFLGLMSFLALQVWNLNTNISAVITDIENVKQLVQQTSARQMDFEDIVNLRTSDRFTKSDAMEMKKDLGKRIEANTELIKAIKKD